MRGYHRRCISLNIVPIRVPTYRTKKHVIPLGYSNGCVEGMRASRVFSRTWVSRTRLSMLNEIFVAVCSFDCGFRIRSLSFISRLIVVRCLACNFIRL